MSETKQGFKPFNELSFEEQAKINTKLKDLMPPFEMNPEDRAKLDIKLKEFISKQFFDPKNLINKKELVILYTTFWKKILSDSRKTQAKCTYCKKCVTVKKSMCSCGIRYCGQECQKKDWVKHKIPHRAKLEEKERETESSDSDIEIDTETKVFNYPNPETEKLVCKQREIISSITKNTKGKKCCVVCGDTKEQTPLIFVQAMGKIFCQDCHTIQLQM